MPRISDLDLLDESAIDGSESIPVLKDGASKRAPLAALKDQVTAEASAIVADIKLAEWPFDTRNRNEFGILYGFQEYLNTVGNWTANQDGSFTFPAGVGQECRLDLRRQEGFMPAGTRVLAIFETTGTPQNLRIRASSVDYAFVEEYPGRWAVLMTLLADGVAIDLRVENASASDPLTFTPGYAIAWPNASRQIPQAGYAAMQGIVAADFAQAPGNLWPPEKKRFVRPAASNPKVIHYGPQIRQDSEAFIACRVTDMAGEPANIAAVWAQAAYQKSIGGSSAGENLYFKPLYKMPGIRMAHQRTPVENSGGDSGYLQLLGSPIVKGVQPDVVIEDVQVFHTPPPRDYPLLPTPAWSNDYLIVDAGPVLTTVWKHIEGDKWLGYQMQDQDVTNETGGGVTSNFQALFYGRRVDEFIVQPIHWLTHGNAINEFAVASDEWADDGGSGGHTHKYEDRRAPPVTTIDGVTYAEGARYRGPAQSVTIETFANIYETGNLANLVGELTTTKTFDPDTGLTLKVDFLPNQDIVPRYLYMAMLEIRDEYDGHDANHEGTLLTALTLPNQGDANYGLNHTSVNPAYPNESFFRLETALGFDIEMEAIDGWTHPDRNSWLSLSVRYKAYFAYSGVYIPNQGLPGAVPPTHPANQLISMTTRYTPVAS